MLLVLVQVVRHLGWGGSNLQGAIHSSIAVTRLQDLHSNTDMYLHDAKHRFAALTLLVAGWHSCSISISFTNPLQALSGYIDNIKQ